MQSSICWLIMDDVVACWCTATWSSAAPFVNPLSFCAAAGNMAAACWAASACWNTEPYAAGYAAESQSIKHYYFNACCSMQSVNQLLS